MMIDLANNAHGYIKIFGQIIHIVIFRGCHIYWKDLLKFTNRFQKIENLSNFYKLLIHIILIIFYI